jgi:FAD/FMN-containing dehydrogenase
VTSKNDFSDFPSAFRGPTFAPDAIGYDDARLVWNGRFGHQRPAFIARCVDGEDAALAAAYASGRDLPIAVKSGGHGVDGYAMPEGEFVIDLSQLKEVDIDAQTRRARFGAGTLLGELDGNLQEHGLAVPAGTVSTTGIAGLTLGGGLGFLSPRFGLTVDNLRAVNMVTVEGERVRASEDENADLFWALRGAGHNLGIVTSFEYEAHELGPEVWGGFNVYSIDQAESILAQLDAFRSAAPRELTVLPVILIRTLPLPLIPEEMIGGPALMVVVIYTGPLDRAEAAVDSVRELGEPVVSLVGETEWTWCQSMLDNIALPGRRTHSRGGYIARFDTTMVSTIIDHFASAPEPANELPTGGVAFTALAGRVHEIDEDAMAFSRSGSAWLWELVQQWDEPDRDDEFTSWGDALLDKVRPYELGNGYVNLSLDRGPEWLRGLYGSADKYERIERVKTAWDPRNLLRHNKNIAPARVAESLR